MNEQSNQGHWIRKFLNMFLTGITATLPFFLTIYVLYKSFSIVDGILGGPIYRITGHRIPGLGFIITISLICFVGFFTRQYVGQKILIWIESLVLKIPLAQLIYSGAKDISDLLSKKSKERFTQVVSVPFPYPGAVSLGFLTKEHLSLAGKDLQAVFVPTTPNPFNGFLIYMKRSEITPLNISVDTAVKMIVTMGAVSPDILHASIINPDANVNFKTEGDTKL